MKRNYYQLALMYHPDRVGDSEKDEAKQKFQIIHDAYTILSDAKKKQAYDNGTDVLFSNTSTAKWEHFLKEVDTTAMNTGPINYQGTLQEKNDVKREFVIGNGSLTHLLNTIPFMRREDEDRVTEIIKDLIRNEQVPRIPIKKLRK